MDTFQIVSRGLAKHLGIDVSEITPEVELMTLGLDSLDAAELLMELEDKLDVEVKETKRIVTVADLVAAINEAAKN